MADVKVPALLHKMSKAAQKAWYKKNNMAMPDDAGGRSAAAAKKVKVAPRKEIAIEPGSVRALNAARLQAYMAKGGRQPIGAMGSGGSNVMAGGGQSTIKDLKASIKAGFNPKVSLDPYESERAKKIGPRSLKMKKEEVQVYEAMSPEAAKKKRIFDLKLKMIKKVANYTSRTKSSKVDEPHSSLNPASDMKLNPKAPSGGGKNYYKEETQIDEVTGYEGVKDRKDIIKRAAAMNRMGKDVFLARVKTRAAEIKKEKASKELAKEEVQIDEVTKKEAEVALGGPVKEKPKMSPGKQPAGYRYVRGLARKAMKAGMKKEEVALDEMDKSQPAAGRDSDTPFPTKPIKVTDKQRASAKLMTRELLNLAKKQLKKEEVEQMYEEPKDAADEGEYDYEGDMAKSQLRSIMANSKRMHDMLEENTNLPEWVQSKITLAEDYISTASNYMQGEMNEEVEQVDEKINLVKAKMGTVIKDFKKSDAPQFKGKSMEKRRQMAIAAKLGAEREAGMREEVEQLSERSYLQYSGVIHSNVGNAKHGEEKDEGHHYTLTVPSHRDVGDHLSGKRAYSRVARENPHLEPHHVKAILQSTGNDKEDVEVEHGGKTYKHRLYNNQDPDYIGEEVEQVDEQSPAEIKAKYYHDQFDKVKPVKAYDKEGKLVGRYRSMDHAKQMKPGHTYKVEEEVVAEAEGKVAVTPKEKALAAHHGDKTRITFGDVLKARLKSVAAKKMGK